MRKLNRQLYEGKNYSKVCNSEDHRQPIIVSKKEMENILDDPEKRNGLDGENNYLIDGLSKSDNYLLNTIQRLQKTKDFCQKKMNQQFETEQDFWKIFTMEVRNINSLKTPLRDLIINSQIKD